MTENAHKFVLGEFSKPMYNFKTLNELESIQIKNFMKEQKEEFKLLKHKNYKKTWKTNE